MKKGISEIVLIVLILMIAISLTSLLYVWSTQTSEKLYEDVNQENVYMRERACLGIDSITDTTITINNCGFVPLQNFTIYVNGVSKKVVSESLDPSKKKIIAVNVQVGNKVYVTSDYAESPVVTYIGQGDCGNGVIETNEQCDDGNPNNNDICLNDCKWAACGDGFVCTSGCSPPEECDDGNSYPGDGCTSFCTLEPEDAALICYDVDDVTYSVALPTGGYVYIWYQYDGSSKFGTLSSSGWQDSGKVNTPMNGIFNSYTGKSSSDVIYPRGILSFECNNVLKDICLPEVVKAIGDPNPHKLYFARNGFSYYDAAITLLADDCS